MDWNPKLLDPNDVTVHRRGRGQPLVLLHCLGMDWTFWDVLEPLTDRFELFAYSFPGHHETKLPKGQYGEADLTEQLRALMQREGIPRRTSPASRWAARSRSTSPARTPRWSRA